MNTIVENFKNDRVGDEIFNRATGPRLLNCIEELENMYRERRRVFYDEALEVFKGDADIFYIDVLQQLTLSYNNRGERQ
jgi:hypothetical protein